MDKLPSSLARLSDLELIAQVKRLAARECQVTAELVACIGELDARKIYLGEGYPSTFAYCVTALHLSENATYNRIEVARLARRLPLVLDRLAEGAVSLTAVRLLGKYLTEENHLELLDAAKHASCAEVEKLIAKRFPKPDVPEVIRKLPTRQPLVSSAGCAGLLNSEPRCNTVGVCAHRPELVEHEDAAALADGDGGVAGMRELRADSTHVEASEPAGSMLLEDCDVRAQPAACQVWAGDTDRQAADDREPAGPDPARTLVVPSAAAPVRPAAVRPLSEDRYKLQATIRGKTREKLRRIQDLLRSRVPNGDLDRVFDLAFDALLDKLERAKFAKAERPRKSKRPASTTSRHISAEVKRVVWQRDQGQCTYVGRDGQRCSARALLEFHHLVPFAAGGRATVSNLRLTCRLHNDREAEQYFGSELMVRKKKQGAASDRAVERQAKGGAERPIT